MFNSYTIGIVDLLFIFSIIYMLLFYNKKETIMSIDKDKELGSEFEQECGCGCEHDDNDCGCDDDGCGCGHDHVSQTITLTLDDDTVLECPIIDAFEIEEQSYIALLHPIEETVLLYRYFDNDDDTIDLETIDSDEEFELVSKTYLALQDDYE
jgi:hypothetical protein